MISSAELDATTLLLVEDNAADARLVRDCLRDTGATGIVLEHVTSLSSALERIAGGGIDAVLLDLALGHREGIDTFQLIRSAARDEPIILLSDSDDRERALHAVASGAQDYLVKGRFDASTLVRTIQYATHRKLAERALHESDDRFRALVENGNDGIAVFSELGLLLYCSPSTQRILGYAPETLLGKSGLHLVKETDRPRMAAMLAYARENPGAGSVDRARLRHSDGSWRIIEATVTNMLANPAIGGIVFNYRDVTRQQEADDQVRERDARLAENAERFRLLSEVTYDGIAIIRDGKVIEANPELAQLIGAGGESAIIGRDWTDFVADELRSEVGNRLHGGAEGRSEFRLVRPDGRVLTVEATSRRHVMNGQPVQIMAVRDLTEKRAVEERLRHAEKMEAVGQLAGGVAHDFNNILAAILITAELVLDGTEFGAQAREDVRTIHAAAKRGADITRQLLSFSRKQVTTPVAVDLGDVIEEMAPMLGQLATANTSIETQLGATHGVEADPVQIEQVVLNLVINARDAMPRGGTIHIETRDVDIAGPTGSLALTSGPYVVLVVSDTGSGIEESVRARLFEPFFTTKAPGKGTGLGLSTVASIVRSLNGGIQVNSRPGAGATFEVYLPALPVSTRLVASQAATPAARGRETILVVEDETAVRTSICRMLRSLGYHTIEAKNGSDALWIRGRHAGPIDLVVTDVVMPEMSGPDMIGELRRGDPDLPAVILSGYTDPILDTKALQPRTVFLAKPFTSAVLAAKVREQLDQARPTYQLELDHGDVAVASGAVA